MADPISAAATNLRPTIVWFRQDLRLADNPALTWAVDRGAPICPVFILDDDTPGHWRPGGAARWWLHHSLAALDADLQTRGNALLLRRGRADIILPALTETLDAGAVVWNRLYEPWARDRDARMKDHLKSAGLTVKSFNGTLLYDPWVPKTGNGDPYRVFSPFWKALLKLDAAEPPLPCPHHIPAPQEPQPAKESLNDWHLTPSKPDWADGLRKTWTPGETGAQNRFSCFLDAGLAAYNAQRNRPDIAGTSAMSPHLHWGEISPRQIWHATKHRMDEAGAHESGMAYLREIGWREFSYHLLYWWPDLPDTTWKSAFQNFPWHEDEAAYRQWIRGATGYPIVDAGMRQLYRIGWMHNRVRMIVGSFLVKDLLIPWQWGEQWFWDTLVDADLANNSASWQWIAGCGADAAPYFRIFNPVTQGQKFDPGGTYVRQWVPEIAQLPDKYLHAPWTAPDHILGHTGITLGQTYPRPIVDHTEARRRALEAFETIKAA